jgi:hypothetical protein
MRDYRIVQPEHSKGRAFTTTCLAMSVGNLFDEHGKDGVDRPIWATFAGSEQELRAFVINLRTGKKAEPTANHSDWPERIEFLRSLRYRVLWQREEEGALATLYHPEVFRLDPGFIEAGRMRFALMLPAGWGAAQGVDALRPVRHCRQFKLPVSDGELAALAPVACLFAAYIDRRTRCPIIADTRFYLQLLVASLATGLATRAGKKLRCRSYDRDEWATGRHDFNALGLDQVGVEHALAFSSGSEEFESFLSEQTSLFLRTTKGK